MKPISELGYEEARDELIDVVRPIVQVRRDADGAEALAHEDRRAACLERGDNVGGALSFPRGTARSVVNGS